MFYRFPYAKLIFGLKGANRFILPIRSNLFNKASFSVRQTAKGIMLVSSSASSSSVQTLGNDTAGVGIVPRILQIQAEMLIINRHNREHSTGKPNDSCVYCQRKRELLQQHQILESQHPKNEVIVVKPKKKIQTLNEIVRSVDVSGKNSYVSVPRSWAGKRVKITLLDD